MMFTRRLLNDAGFSLLEVLIASLLIVGSLAAMQAGLVAAARWNQTNSNSAYNTLRANILDRLYEEVDATKFDTPASLLAHGKHKLSDTDQNKRLYSANYKVEPVDMNGDGIEDYRKVKGTVEW